MTPRQRADARENRARILRAAVDALRESPGVSLNAIAKRAGVGIGTLYRHFPTREALLVAVYHSELGQLVASAYSFLETMSPSAALAAWLDRLADSGRAKSGFSDALANATTHDRLAGESYGPVLAALGALLAANEVAGDIRPGIDPDDVLTMLGFLWRVTPDDDGAAKAKRMLQLLLEGLRGDTPSVPRAPSGSR